MSVIVKMEHVTKQFGGLTAVNDFSGEIEKNAIVGLIGPNGAGKTTLFNMIANYYHPTSGKIYFKDQDITCLLYTSSARWTISCRIRLPRPAAARSLRETLASTCWNACCPGCWNGSAWRITASPGRTSLSLPKAPSTISSGC